MFAGAGLATLGMLASATLAYAVSSLRSLILEVMLLLTVGILVIFFVGNTFARIVSVYRP